MKKRLLLATVAYAALLTPANAFEQILGVDGIDTNLSIDNRVYVSGGSFEIGSFDDISQVALNVANAIGTSGTGFNPVIVGTGVSVNQGIADGVAEVPLVSALNFTSVTLEAENVITLGQDDPLDALILSIDEVSQISANSLNVAGLSYEGDDASFVVDQSLDMQAGQYVYIEASNLINATTADGSAFVGSDDADDPATVDIDESANEVQAALNRLNALSLSSTTGEPTITLNQLADLVYSESGGGMGSGGAFASLYASNVIVAGSFVDGPIVTPPGAAPVIYDPTVLGTDQVGQISVNTVSIAATSGATIVDLADVSGGTGELELPPGYVIGSGDFTGELGYDDTPIQYIDGFESGGNALYGEIEVSNVIIAATQSSGPIEELYSGGGVNYTGNLASGGDAGGIGDVVVGDLAQTAIISLNTIAAQGIADEDLVDLTLGQDEVFTVTTSGGTDTVVGYLGVDQVVEELTIGEGVNSGGGHWAVNENTIKLYTDNGDVTLYEADQTRAVSINTLSTDGALIGGFDTEQAAGETEFTQSLLNVDIDVDNVATVESTNLGDAVVDGLSQTNVGSYNSIRAGEFLALNVEQTATDVSAYDNDNFITVRVDDGMLNVGDVSQINSQSVNSASATDYAGAGFVGDALVTGPSLSQLATNVDMSTLTNRLTMEQNSGDASITLDGLSQTGLASVNTLQGGFDGINVSQVAVNVDLIVENRLTVLQTGGSINVDAVAQTAVNRVNAITATPAPSVE